MNKDRVLYTVKVTRGADTSGLPMTSTYKDVRAHQLVAGEPTLLVLNDRHGCRLAILPITGDMKIDFVAREVKDLPPPEIHIPDNGLRH